MVKKESMVIFPIIYHILPYYYHTILPYYYHLRNHGFLSGISTFHWDHLDSFRGCLVRGMGLTFSPINPWWFSHDFRSVLGNARWPGTSSVAWRSAWWAACGPTRRREFSRTLGRIMEDGEKPWGISNPKSSKVGQQRLHVLAVVQERRSPEGPHPVGMPNHGDIDMDRIRTAFNSGI